MLERAQDRLLLEPRWRDPGATPYEILGVEPGASSEAIRHAYLTLAWCCHPDRYPDRPHLRAQAELLMKRVNVAYRELSSALSILRTTQAANARVSVRRSKRARGISTTSSDDGDVEKTVMGQRRWRTNASVSEKVGTVLAYQAA